MSKTLATGEFLFASSGVRKSPHSFIRILSESRANAQQNNITSTSTDVSPTAIGVSRRSALTANYQTINS